MPGREIWRGSTNHPWVDRSLGANRPANEHLRLCDGNVPYRGAMNATRDGNGAWRTVNRVLGWRTISTGRSLRVDPVVGRLRWQGGAAGAGHRGALVRRGRAPLRLRADLRHPVLPGLPRIVQRGLADHRSRPHHERNRHQARQPDQAAEFSSSSGGFTAGASSGRRRRGDVVSPNRNWQQTVTAGAIANAYGVGELISFDVIGRNNLGADGGRVTRVKVVGTARTVEGSGDEARWKLGLKSDWFTVGGPGAPGPIPACRSRRARSSRCRCRSCRRCPRSPRGRWSRSCRRCPVAPLPPGSAAPLPFAAAAG